MAPALLLLGTCAGRGEEGAPAETYRFLRVTGEKVAVPIVDPRWHFGVGAKADLLHESRRHYFLAVPTASGATRVCVAPRFGRGGRGTAWVTNERRVIFGERTRTCKGKLPLQKGALLPVLSETRDAYVVTVSGQGHQARIEVPRGFKGVELVTFRPAAPAEKPAKPASTSATRAPPPAQPAPAVSSAAPAPADGATNDTAGTAVPPGELAAQLKEVVLLEILDGLKEQRSRLETRLVEQPGRDESGGPAPAPAGVTQVIVRAVEVPAAGTGAVVRTVQVEGPGTPDIQEPAEPVPPAEPRGPRPDQAQPMGWVHFLDLHAVTLRILLGVCIIEAVLLVRKRRRNGAAGEPARGGRSDLSGKLQGRNLGEVIQFLHSAGESGTLRIAYPDRSREDTVLFDEGRIIEADAGGEASGPDAVPVMLKRGGGSFDFTREDMSSRESAFAADTMSVLLDAARALDEQPNEAGPADAPA